MTSQRLREIEEIYAALPKLECKGECHYQCRGIQLSKTERDSLRQRTGIMFVGNEPKRLCPFLTKDKKCSVYDIRPLVCRLWGLTERMTCPHGCKPDRYLTDAEEFTLLSRVMYIGGSYTRSEHRQDMEWVEDPEFFAIVRKAMRSDLTGVNWEMAQNQIDAIRARRAEKGNR